MNKHLNGWQRLWIVATIFYTVAIFMVMIIGFPNNIKPSESATLIQKLPKEQRDLLEGKSTDNGLKVEYPNGHVLKFEYGVSEIQTLPIAKAYGNLLSKELSARRMKFIVFILIAWIAPIITILCVGRAAAWVREGFKISEP